MEFQDMVDGENHQSFDQPTNITWEHALNLFTSADQKDRGLWGRE